MPLDLSPETIAAINADSVTSFYLYEIRYGEAGQALRYTNFQTEVVYQGKTYTPNVIKHNDITTTSDGKVNDMNVTVGNADRIIQDLIEGYEMIGKTVKLIQIVKLAGGALSGNELVFSIKRASCKKDWATITLGIGLDMLKSYIPARKILSRFCWWVFKGSDCQYAGADTQCTRTFEECKKKGNQARFGGFPGVLQERFYF